MEERVIEQDTTIEKLQRQIEELQLVNKNLIRKSQLRGEADFVSDVHTLQFRLSGVVGPLASKLNCIYTRSNEKYNSNLPRLISQLIPN